MREAYTTCIYIPTWLRQNPDADLPLTDLVKARGLAGSCGVLRDWQNCLDYPELQPAWMAGNLSSIMDILPPEDKPHLYGIMLQCRQLGVQQLRQEILEQAKSNSAPRISLLLQIMFLFREGYIRERSQGVEAYGIILQYVERAHVDIGTAFNLLSIAMFNDSEAACKKLKHTVLDYEGWMAKRYKTFWAHVESYLPPTSSVVETGLHPSLANADSVINGAVLRIRRCMDMSERVSPLAMQTPEDYMAGDLRWAWVATTGLHDMGLLVNQYCDLTDGRSKIDNKDDLWSYDLRITMTLTTLFTLRKLVHGGSCNGVDLREAQLIMPTMETVLRRALRLSTEKQRWESREILMWIYFTGAWHGQNIHRQRQCSIFGDHSTPLTWPKAFDATWFDRQLSAQAHRLRLTTWCHAREFLKAFTYSELIRPHPTEWYESIVTLCRPVDFAGLCGEGSEPGVVASSPRDISTKTDSPFAKPLISPLEFRLVQPHVAMGEMLAYRR